jgi:hypothetical protein
LMHWSAAPRSLLDARRDWRCPAVPYPNAQGREKAHGWPQATSLRAAHSETALAAFAIAVAGQGNVRVQTLRAYSASEMDGILAKLP